MDSEARKEKLKEVKDIQEFKFNGVYYCVVTNNDNYQTFKTNTQPMRGTEEHIIEILDYGENWKQFLKKVNSIRGE